MASPLTTKRNDYHSNTKNSTVYTPKSVSQAIYDVIETHRSVFRKWSKHPTKWDVFDPCIGAGNLVQPFVDDSDNYTCYGNDIDLVDNGARHTCCSNFLKWEKIETDFKLEKPDLTIINPPFNRDQRNIDFLKSKKLGKALLPDLFLKKVFELFGNDHKVALVTPMGFRLNQKKKSKRWKEYSRLLETTNITSIMSLPLNVFEGVAFHIEVLFWNISHIKPHYWMTEEQLKLDGEDYDKD